MMVGMKYISHGAQRRHGLPLIFNWLREDFKDYLNGSVIIQRYYKNTTLSYKNS